MRCANILLIIINLHSLSSQNDDLRNTIVVTMSADPIDTIKSVPRECKVRHAKIKYIRNNLKAHARNCQTTVFRFLTQHGASFSRSESLWLTNQIVVYNATMLLMHRLRRFKAVAQVEFEVVIPLLDEVEVAFESALSTQFGFSISDEPTVNWNIEKVGAVGMWDAGYNGTGVVVGSIDTGVRATHDAIDANFRRSYNWYDPEKKAMYPYDSTGHGTHVTGILAGRYGLGVAPGASWIMCKGCRATGCIVSELIACFQFMLCPTRYDGSGKDCSKAPDVVNNSWGAGQGVTTFNSVINALRTAGIIPVFASGNTGPGCGTVVSPSDGTSVIAVGAIDKNDMLGSYSGKGPTVKGVMKPDLVAPGSSITSSCHNSDQDLCVKTGTSMAAPHVSGAIALYLSRFPGSTYSSVRAYLEKYAGRATLQFTGYSCGSNPYMYPNNDYGFGQVRLPAP